MMKLVNRIVGSAGVGLLGLVLLATAADARTNFHDGRGLSIGLRGGGILPRSDLDGVVWLQGATFLRYGIMQKLQAELGVGYGHYTTEDISWTNPTGEVSDWIRDPDAVEEYYTHLSYVQLRLLWAPVLYDNWAPYLYGGAGYTYYNVEDLTPRRGDFDGIGRTLGIPLGVGVRRELSERVGVEGSFGYTVTMSDEIDESDDGGSNDHYFDLSLGLTYDLTIGGYRPPMPEPEVVRPELPVDTDGDGLTDEEERTKYFTNPQMADTDGDGLNDGAEVKVYGTDPNKADTDGGGVNDGDEVERGTDPLDPADDVVEVRVVPLIDYDFPVVTFASEAAELSSAARRELDAAARVLRENRGVVLEVRGHADSTGYRVSNMRLSRRRAYAVEDYMAEQGVAPWRLSVRAYGSAQPVATNKTAEGRSQNRRVELEQVR